MIKIKSIAIALVTFLVSTISFGQGGGFSCEDAGCTIGGVYPSIPSSPSMGQFGCLYSTPNPYWVAINITSTGSVHMILTQSGDIDFAAYGPFSSVSDACPITGSTPTVDCSYSASGTEYIDLYNVSPGQVYVILITNFSGAQVTYNLQPTGNNTASFDCNINFGATPTSTPALCGQPTGTATVTPNGGTEPYTYSWNLPGNPTTPTVTGLAPGTYSVTINSAPNPTTNIPYNPVTVNVTVGNTLATYSGTSTPAACITGNNGTATANFGNVPAGVTATAFQWNDAAQQTTQTAVGLSPGAYACAVTLSNGCTGNVTVYVGAGSVTSSGTSTVESCEGALDGTATATMLPAGNTYTYQWNDPAGQTTQTATGLAMGVYSCVITNQFNCSSTAMVAVGGVPGMQGTFITSQDVSCYTLNNGVLAVNVSQGTPPYSYSWNNSTSTTNTANDLYVGPHTVTITDFKGCVLTMSDTLSEPAPLSIISMTPDTRICPEDPITLAVEITGGSSEYLYTWTMNGDVISTENQVTVDPAVTNTTYCVHLEEACGSPSLDTCVVISFPVPTTPALVADKYVDCRPGQFFLTNTSNNLAEIATTYYDFGNNTNVIIQAGDTTSVIYPESGVYTLQMINTSIYGCVYDTTLVDFFTVTPDPIANFYIGGSPTTIFETTLTAHSLSSPDVIQWEWYSPHSIPVTSALEDPKFTFPEGVEGVYPVTLIVTSIYGCKDTITLNAIVNEDILLFVPNTFTPDGDEFNQTWKFSLRGGDPYTFEMRIFNRWGECVWETKDVNSEWDGYYGDVKAEQGQYTWVASVKNRGDDGRITWKGHVIILK